MQENQVDSGILRQSDSITNLLTAVMEVAIGLPAIQKTARNPFTESNYAPLPDILKIIREPMLAKGLLFTQIPAGKFKLYTILVHSESGEFIQAWYEMKPSKDNPQGVGGAITYMRRYALTSMLGLPIDEDDDGNEASGLEKKYLVNKNGNGQTAETKQAKKALDQVKPESIPMTDEKLKAMVDYLKQWNYSKGAKKNVKDRLVAYKMTDDQKDAITDNLDAEPNPELDLSTE